MALEKLDTVGATKVEVQFSEPPNAAWSSNKAVIPRAEGTL